MLVSQWVWEEQSRTKARCRDSGEHVGPVPMRVKIIMPGARFSWVAITTTVVMGRFLAEA